MPKHPDRLKTAIHVAREKAGVPSDMQLSHRAGVSYDTLMNWYAGRTVPRPNELKKVADAAGTSLLSLMDAYEGRDPEPPTLVDAIQALVSELRASRMTQERLLEVVLESDPTPTGSEAPEGVLEPPERTRARRPRGGGGLTGVALGSGG